MLSIHIPFYNLVLQPFDSLIISAVEIVKSLIECRNKVLSLRAENTNVGFVPTMGALHQGHLELIKQAVSSCDFVVASIFVNPAQFNSREDFEKYPKTFNADVDKLRKAGCDMLFVPSDKDMYPTEPAIKIAFPDLQRNMEGRFRPGHFEGVSLVVSKLFHIVPAQKAFFGQKDWQQTLVVKRLVSDLLFDIEIVTVPTAREADGLAMSSRNERLSPANRLAAPVFNRCLCMAREQLLAGTPLSEVESMVKREFESGQEVALEYFEVANRETLEPVSAVDTKVPVSLFIAGYAGGVRLIDNIFLQEETDNSNAN